MKGMKVYLLQQVAGNQEPIFDAWDQLTEQEKHLASLIMNKTVHIEHIDTQVLYQQMVNCNISYSPCKN